MIEPQNFTLRCIGVAVATVYKLRASSNHQVPMRIVEKVGGAKVNKTHKPRPALTIIFARRSKIQGTEPGDVVDDNIRTGERRSHHSSSSRRHRGSVVVIDPVRAERDRCGDEVRRRKKKSHGEHQASSRRSSSRLE